MSINLKIEYITSFERSNPSALFDYVTSVEILTDEFYAEKFHIQYRFIPLYKKARDPVHGYEMNYDSHDCGKYRYNTISISESDLRDFVIDKLIQ
jgi:hypothetical protein